MRNEFESLAKEPWPVRYMLDYYIKTGSLRIMEVLVKAQTPHDGYIFDRLDDWLKHQQHRTQALNVFCFIVRHHPTWLHKIEKHRLIKSVFKLLTVSWQSFNPSLLHSRLLNVFPSLCSAA